MIDTSKLLSIRTSSKALLSREGVTNLIIIKKNVVKIDGLLKERLVLSKVREGLLKQQRENERRREREKQLETERKDDDTDVNPKSKKKPKSMLGGILKAILGGFLKFIGKLLFRILPRLPFLIKVVTKFSKLFFNIITGGFRLIRSIVGLGAPLIKGLGGVTKTLFTSILGVIKKGAIPLIGQLVNAIRGIAITASVISGTRGLVTSATRPAVRPTVDPKIKRVGSKQLSFDDIFQREGFLRDIERQRILEEGTTDKLQIEKKRLAKERQLALFDKSPKGGTQFIDPESFKQRKTVTKKFTAQDFVQEDFIQTKSRFGSLAVEAEESKKLLERLGIGEARKIPKVLADKNFLLDKETVEKLLKTNIPDADAESLIFKAFTDKKAAQDVGQDALLDAIKRAKPPSVGKKGLAKFLGNIGGAQFLKPIRKFLNNTVKQIPFLGDLIGLLLDIFVFGEPVGRAAFMAIGGILGGFLGGAVGSLVPGPGTIIGGIIGGIGGDLVGGLIYDLIFGRKPAVNEAGTVTKGVVKGVSKGVQKFEEGGLVREYEPLPQIPFDKSTNLRSLAFYEKTQVGREVMVPIPIPIPSSRSQSQGSNIVVNQTSEKRTAFSQHYRRG